ncbi:MAG: GPW/gp25 family protein [Planctomycetota bacterium]|nr:GPW/gp25 family protein [Planctomycetota bacterium]
MVDVEGRRKRRSDGASPGWSLPLVLDGEGRLAGTRENAVEDTLRLILEIAPGERPLMPAFGCRVQTMPPIAGERDRHLAAALIEEAIDRWAPWLGVREVEVVEAREGALRLSVDCGRQRREFSIRLFGQARDRTVAAAEGSP